MYQVYKFRLYSGTDTMDFRGSDRAWAPVSPTNIPADELWVGILIDDSLHGNGRWYKGCIAYTPLFVSANPTVDYKVLRCFETKLAYEGSVKTKPIFVYIYPHGFRITSVDNEGGEAVLVDVPTRGPADPIVSHACEVDFNSLVATPDLTFAFTAVFDGRSHYLCETTGHGWYMIITDKASVYPNQLAAYFVSKDNAMQTTTSRCKLSATGELQPLDGAVWVKETDTPHLAVGSNFTFNGVPAIGGVSADEVRQLIRIATEKFIVR